MKTDLIKSTKCAIAAILLLSSLPLNADYEVVAIAGQASPDGNGIFSNDTFQSTQSFLITDFSNAGEIAFTSTLIATSDIRNDFQGAFKYSEGNLETIVRSGQPLPGFENSVTTPGFLQQALILDESGVYSGTFTESDEGLFGISLVYKDALNATTIVPRISDLSIILIEHLDTDHTDRVAFTASYVIEPDTIGKDLFIWERNGGEGTLTKAGLHESINTFFPLSGLKVNKTGTAAIASGVEGLTLWKDQKVATFAVPLSATPAGDGTFGAFTDVGFQLNNRGQVLFSQEITGFTSSYFALFLSDPNNNLREILRTGSPIPGTSETIAGFRQTLLDDNGDIIMHVIANEGFSNTDVVLRYSSNGELTELFRFGDPIPNDERTFATIQSLTINNSGQVAFIAASSGSGFSTGIYLYDFAKDEMRTVVDNQGSFINGNEVLSVSNRWNSASFPNYLNDHGQIVFNFTYADERKGIAIWTPSENDSQLINLSTRGLLGSGIEKLVPGFVYDGVGEMEVLLRVIGSGLESNFPGVFNSAADPSASLKLAATEIASNDDWNTNSNVAEIRTVTNALAPGLPLSEGSADAAMLATIRSPKSPYTLTTGNTDTENRVGLVEVYDTYTGIAQEAPNRLINISTRGLVGTGPNKLVGGFTIAGNDPMRLLIRGLGPNLGPFFAEKALRDPELILFDSGSNEISRNDNWNSTDAAMMNSVALPLEPGSLDSAMIVTLVPGSYTVHLKGIGAETGIGLLEIFAIDK